MPLPKSEGGDDGPTPIFWPFSIKQDQVGPERSTTFILDFETELKRLSDKQASQQSGLVWSGQIARG